MAAWWQTRAFPVVLAGGATVYAIWQTLPPDFLPRFWPHPLPNRIEKIKEEDLPLRIDNEDIYDNERFWWHPQQPLIKLNAARVPWYLHQLERHRRSPNDESDDQEGQWQPRNVAASYRVLDVGCGAGLVTEDLARAGYDTSGIDLSSNSIDVARQHAADGDLKINYVVGSALDLPFGDGTFDAVLSSDVVEHMLDLPRYAAEIARVLKPRGIFVYDTINRTTLSWLLSYLAPQELRILPRDAHRWELFVTPSEMDVLLSRAGLLPASSTERTGMRPQLRPIALLRAFFSRRYEEDAPRRWHVVGPAQLCASTSQSYLHYAVKS